VFNNLEVTKREKIRHTVQHIHAGHISICTVFHFYRHLSEVFRTKSRKLSKVDYFELNYDED